MVIVCHQTIWIAAFVGVIVILLAVAGISQRQWSLLLAAAGFAVFGWFFVRRDWLEVDKSARQVTFKSFGPFGLRTTHFAYDDIKDLVFEGTGVYFRPALATSGGIVALTNWYSQGSPRGRERLRVRFLAVLGKLRADLV